jgi:predicted phosphodiesterase
MIRNVEHKIGDKVKHLLVISDAHGCVQPLSAFDKVRSGIEGRSVLIFNGDAFSGGPRPAEVAAWIIDNAGNLATIGNHDEAMLAGGDGDEPCFTERGAYQRLSRQQRNYFQDRPHRLELSWNGKRIVLMHGHINRHGDEGSWLASPDEQSQVFHEPDADLCVVSHTHYAYVREVNGTIMANSGSVAFPLLGIREGSDLHTQSGKPEIEPDEDFRSSFLDITLRNDRLLVELTRFNYDRRETLEEIEDGGHPRYELMTGWLTTGIVVRG